MTKWFTSILSTLFIVLIFLSSANAQSVRRPRTKPGLDLSPAAAQERWTEFTSSQLGSDYCMDFEIIHRPRKSKEIKYVGYMLGTERGGTLYTRIRIYPVSEPAKAEEYIMRNSISGGSVWRFKDSKFVKIDKADWLKPLYEGLLYSPFDLLMPYKYWQSRYAGAGHVGQAVHLYDLNSGEFPNSRVRIALTRDFNVPAQIQIFGVNGDKTALLGAVKKVDDLWFMSEASVKDESTKDKDILRIKAVRFKITLPMSIFEPTSAKDIALPQTERL